MKKNMKKYSKEEVIREVCKKGLVEDNWPGRKKLTVTEMLKIAIENGLPYMEYCYLLISFDRGMWDELNEPHVGIEEMANQYIEDN